MRGLETLEKRTFFSNTAYATFKDGILRMFGTDADESFTIGGRRTTRHQGFVVSDVSPVIDLTDTIPNTPKRYAAFVGDEQVLSFDFRKLKKIIVHAGGGNDGIGFREYYEVFNTVQIGYYYPTNGGDVVGDKYRSNTYRSIAVAAYGEDGNDSIKTGYGDDSLDGGSGDDTLNGNLGADSMSGDDGTDTVSYLLRTQPLAIQLGTILPTSSDYPVPYGPNGALNDDGTNNPDLITQSGFKPSAENYKRYLTPDTKNLFGTGGRERDVIDETIENVIGGDFNDVIIGNQAPNRIEGAGGNDFIVGGLGNDTLLSGAGNDTILAADSRDGMPNSGQAGYDLISGGIGDDILRYDGKDNGTSVETLDKLRFLTM